MPPNAAIRVIQPGHQLSDIGESRDTAKWTINPSHNGKFRSIAARSTLDRVKPLYRPLTRLRQNPSMPDTEFQEIAHSGGTVTFHVVTDPQGRKAYSVQWKNSRGVAAAITGIYALQIGIPVGVFDFGGIGRPFNPPPPPGCFPVFLGSDSEGKFGRQCPWCSGYRRSDSWAKVCPYCGIRGQPHEFLTQAQASYVQQYCQKLSTALAAGDGDHPIDMDAVADAVGNEMQNRLSITPKLVSRTNSTARPVAHSTTF